ncbi:OLC1v1025521C1 [Oldenlandia corymbosa var. corymbosa]|uniref:OLC1v1025521C1 n=1 Tax=Oldenlandia corymbosa var. corymbosa TaxID=529605 RepID=A0AAV1C5M8_OLDCO|nr:OLC1v1025521C1 [Oldenlandia corymbosa var. corymbosa]
MLKAQQFLCYFLLSCTVFLQFIQGVPVNRGPDAAGLLTPAATEKYAVIFDAGSTGSRVHVFHFDKNMDLVKIGQDFEFFEAIKPGLSSYADDPNAAAASLEPLLQQAEAIVPKELQPTTPIKVGATAGLRLLKGDTAEKILEAVRTLIQSESSLKYKAEWVNVLEGTQEATSFWVAINYLVGTAGLEYSKTYGTVDLGGGSVQMTYAVPEASDISIGKKKYVQEILIRGTTYHLYAHSYLRYGLLAGRAEVLKVSINTSHPCIPYGYQGTYTYNGKVYEASALPTGANIKICRAFVLNALKVDAPCEHQACTFNGVWNGGGGAGQKNLYVSSFFYDIAREIGIIDPNAPSGFARPVDFNTAAKIACRTKYSDIATRFPNVEERDRPYICLDLVYQYSLLVDGFGLSPYRKITLVNKIKYKDSLFGAAWPLGYAIQAVSESESSSTNNI